MSPTEPEQLMRRRVVSRIRSVIQGLWPQADVCIYLHYMHFNSLSYKWPVFNLYHLFGLVDDRNTKITEEQLPRCKAAM